LILENLLLDGLDQKRKVFFWDGGRLFSFLLDVWWSDLDDLDLKRKVGLPPFFFWKDLSSSSSLRDLSCEESVFLFPWCFADLLFWWSRSEKRCFPSSSVYCLNRRWELFLFFFMLIFENLLLDDLNHKEKKNCSVFPWKWFSFFLDICEERSAFFYLDFWVSFC